MCRFSKWALTTPSQQSLVSKRPFSIWREKPTKIVCPFQVLQQMLEAICPRLVRNPLSSQSSIQCMEWNICSSLNLALPSLESMMTWWCSLSSRVHPPVPKEQARVVYHENTAHFYNKTKQKNKTEWGSLCKTSQGNHEWSSLWWSIILPSTKPWAIIDDSRSFHTLITTKAMLSFGLTGFKYSDKSWLCLFNIVGNTSRSGKFA